MTILRKIRKLFTSDGMMFAFLCGYLVIGFGTVNVFTCGNHYFNIFCNIVKLWGIVIIFFSLFDKSKWKLDVRFLLLILFIASYLISCFVSAGYGGLMNNVKGVAWVIIQAILLAGIINKGFFTKWLPRLSVIFVCITTIFALVSLFYLIIGFIYIPSLQPGDTLWMGLCSGRLWGFYKDPNYGAIASCVSIFLLLYLVINKLSRKRILAACILVIPEFFYIAFTGSRTALVAIVCGMFVMVITIAFKQMQIINAGKVKQIIVGIASAFVACAMVIGMFFGLTILFDKVEPTILAGQGGPVSDTYQIFPTQLTNITNEKLGLSQINPDADSKYLTGTDKDPNLYANNTSFVEEVRQLDKETAQNASNSQQSSQNLSSSGVQSSTQTGTSNTAESSKSESSHTGLLARSENADISNNRFDLWKTAIKIWLTSPIIGVSHYNILNYATALFPDSRYVTMGQVTSHNAYLDILAAQGIVGLGIFLAIIVITLVGFIKLLVRKNGKEGYQIAVMFGLFVLLLASACFYPELIYINTIDALFFWYIISLVRSEEKMCKIAEKPGDSSLCPKVSDSTGVKD